MRVVRLYKWIVAGTFFINAAYNSRLKSLKQVLYAFSSEKSIFLISTAGFLVALQGS